MHLLFTKSNKGKINILLLPHFATLDERDFWLVQSTPVTSRSSHTTYPSVYSRGWSRLEGKDVDWINNKIFLLQLGKLKAGALYTDIHSAGVKICQKTQKIHIKSSLRLIRKVAFSLVRLNQINMALHNLITVHHTKCE
jgi:hypothetical protein